MRFRPGSILNTPMVIALMAFAIVAFLLMVDTAVFPPKNTNTITVNTNRATNQSQNANTSGNPTGTFETNTNSNGGAAE